MIIEVNEKETGTGFDGAVVLFGISDLDQEQREIATNKLNSFSRANTPILANGILSLETNTTKAQEIDRSMTWFLYGLRTAKARMAVEGN